MYSKAYANRKIDELSKQLDELQSHKHKNEETIVYLIEAAQVLLKAAATLVDMRGDLEQEEDA